MRARGTMAVLIVVVGCGRVDSFTDGGDDDTSIDARTSIDAMPFVCEDQACGPADDCCPTACSANNDDDCAPVCDNGVLEIGEYCDPLALCETSCPAVGCQLRNLTGSGCTAHCENGAQQSNCQS